MAWTPQFREGDIVRVSGVKQFEELKHLQGKHVKVLIVVADSDGPEDNDPYFVKNRDGDYGWVSESNLKLVRRTPEVTT